MFSSEVFHSLAAKKQTEKLADYIAEHFHYIVENAVYGRVGPKVEYEYCPCIVEETEKLHRIAGKDCSNEGGRNWGRALYEEAYRMRLIRGSRSHETQYASASM